VSINAYILLLIANLIIKSDFFNAAC